MNYGEWLIWQAMKGKVEDYGELGGKDIGLILVIVIILLLIAII